LKAQGREEDQPISSQKKRRMGREGESRKRASEKRRKRKRRD